MAAAKTITPQSLAKLGSRRLAELLTEACETDRPLGRKVEILLAAEAGGDKVKSTIAKRISSLARARGFVDWQAAPKFAAELEILRDGIATQLAKKDPQAALELMWRFLELAGPTLERVDDSSGRIGNVFFDAAADLGVLFGRVPQPDRAALAEQLHACLSEDGYGVFARVITSGAEGLGPGGRTRLRDLLMADMDALPAWQEDENLDIVGWPRSRLADQLAKLADAERDVDAYIEAVSRSGSKYIDGAGIAARLIGAGRPAEALDWLKKDRRARGPYDLTIADLRIAALGALEHKAEAQSVRWQTFEKTLSASHLREHLKRLPDFEDFEAEQTAIKHATTFSDALTALNFLVGWPALEAADRLVRQRITELDGRHYDWIGQAAERLSENWPVSATLLYRALVLSVLKRANSKPYKHAARNLSAALLAGKRLPADSGIPDNTTFFAELKAKHGRKYSFWALIPEDLDGGGDLG